MSRVTDVEVRAILEGGQDYDTIRCPSLVPYIKIANVITTRVAECAADRDLTLSSTELQVIEGWLAAHFYVMSDQTYLEKQTSDARAKFQGTTGMRLEASKYGQSATVADYSGCLEAAATRSEEGVTTIRGYWLGKRPSEQTDYSDRD